MASRGPGDALRLLKQKRRKARGPRAGSAGAAAADQFRAEAERRFEGAPASRFSPVDNSLAPMPIPAPPRGRYSPVELGGALVPAPVRSQPRVAAAGAAAGAAGGEAAAPVRSREAPARERERQPAPQRRPQPAVDPPPPAAPRTKRTITWRCGECAQECIPVRDESRCLCGHRRREHPATAEEMRARNATFRRPFACTNGRCKCAHFYFIVAEGAWILRCRCKHKHTDHDPSRGPHPCTKARCACAGFDSPWVCNCGHPWAAHTQQVEEVRAKTIAELMGLGTMDDLNRVQRGEWEDA